MSKENEPDEGFYVRRLERFLDLRNAVANKLNQYPDGIIVGTNGGSDASAIEINKTMIPVLDKRIYATHEDLAGFGEQAEDIADAIIIWDRNRHDH